MNSVKLFKCYNSDDTLNVMQQVYKSGSIAGGCYVKKFESELKAITGGREIVTTNDLTSAITIALKVANVEDGDEIIVSPFSCLASNMPIANLNLMPKWVDFYEDSIEVDSNHFASLVTEKTKVALIYHLAGYPTDLRKIREICDKNNIFLIEDCNNAILAEIGDSLVGLIGDAAIFSFYPNRHLNSLDGGAISFKNVALVDEARKLRKLGVDLSTFRNKDGQIDPTQDVANPGYSASLSNFNASVGYIHCNSIYSVINSHRENAKLYKTLLNGNQDITILESKGFTRPSYWVFLVIIKNGHRDEVIMKLKQRGIDTSSLHQRNDVYSCFNKKCESSLPNVGQVQNKILALPCGWWLSSSEIEFVVQSLNDVFKEYK